MLVETACIECGGLIGEYARETRERVSVNDGQKIAGPAEFMILCASDAVARLSVPSESNAG
jgi:hypothetical protein